MKKLNTTTLAIACAVGSIASANAATVISENFENLTLGGTTPPAGWSLVNYGSGTYTTTVGHAGSNVGGGKGATLDNTGAAGSGGTPGAYLVNSGMAAFDVNQSITGSFDVKLDVGGNYDSGAFMFGDIGDGVDGGSAGELLYTTFNRSNFGNERQQILDGLGTLISPEANVKFTDDNWFTTVFSWTPTTGRTGNFSITVKTASTGTTLYSLTTSTAFTFDSDEAYFAFGDDDAVNTTFDNINITGTAVPEPTTTALLGLGGLALILRRRK